MSRLRSFARKNHPTLQKVLDELPDETKEQAPWWGHCAEIDCLNQALEDGADLSGASSNAVAIGTSRPGHGLPKKTCIACQSVLSHFGVTWNH